jgi:hypothetical protein
MNWVERLVQRSAPKTAVASYARARLRPPDPADPELAGLAEEVASTEIARTRASAPATSETAPQRLPAKHADVNLEAERRGRAQPLRSERQPFERAASSEPLEQPLTRASADAVSHGSPDLPKPSRAESARRNAAAETATSELELTRPADAVQRRVPALAPAEQSTRALDAEAALAPQPAQALAKAGVREALPRAAAPVLPPLVPAPAPRPEPLVSRGAELTIGRVVVEVAAPAVKVAAKPAPSAQRRAGAPRQPTQRRSSPSSLRFGLGVS